MLTITKYNFVFTILLQVLHTVQGGIEEDAEKWLQELEISHSKACNNYAIASWNSGANINEETQKAANEATKKLSELTSRTQKILLERFPKWKSFKNKRLRRAFMFLAISGPGNMTDERMQKLDRMEGEFKDAYSTSTVCKYNDPNTCNLKLDDVIQIMSKSEDPKELAHYFTVWHDKMSEQIPPEKFAEFVAMLTETAVANGLKYESEFISIPYDDNSDDYSSVKFQKMMIGLFDDLSKVYVILHAYMRMKLRKLPEYNGLIEKCGYLPAYITGNMWAQDWSILGKKTTPYPNAPEVDATEAMLKKGYTPLKMYQEADKMFRDLGLIGMSDKFWKYSILEKPNDGREMSCHPQAWDFCLGKTDKDYRIRHCARVNQGDFVTAHHEMGHLEYNQQYANELFVFRSPANPGFGEAIGDAIALAVVTPTHLQCKLDLDLGFGKAFCKQKSGPFNVTETDLNYLYSIALDKLAFFPFAFAVDFFRFEVYEGNYKPSEYNKMWWKIRQQFQGVIPPTDRGSNPKLFDAVSKFHVAANIDYIRYFVSHILQFQFYESLCIAAKEFNPKDKNSKPLYQCDFSGSKEAGKKFANMMKLGKSKGWPDALEALTGSRKISTNSFKNYLKPLLDYMEKELKANGEIVGFGDSCKDVEKRGGKSAWLELVPPNKRPEAKKVSPNDLMYQSINSIILSKFN